jgi:hypothetical protein
MELVGVRSRTEINIEWPSNITVIGLFNERFGEKFL